MYQGVIGKGYNPNVSNLENNDYFGVAVAMNADGTRMAVGAILDNTANNTGNGNGAVYLFSFADQNLNGGSLQSIIGSGYTGGKNINVPLAPQDAFGRAVALNQNATTLAVGASGDQSAAADGSGYGAGYLFRFSDTKFSGNPTPKKIGRGYSGSNNIDISRIGRNERFGNSVALNANGDRLAVGSTGDRGLYDITYYA